MFVEFYTPGNIRGKNCSDDFSGHKKGTLGRTMSKVFDKDQFLNTRNKSQEFEEGIKYNFKNWVPESLNQLYMIPNIDNTIWKHFILVIILSTIINQSSLL